MLEVLDDRIVPSVSSITSTFNGTAISAGSTLWFSSVFKVSGLGDAPATVHVTDQVISFTANGTAYSISVPDSDITFSSATTIATTAFDAGQNTWVTNLPRSFGGNAFLGGVAFALPDGLPGGVKPVVWQANFTTDTAGVSMKWQWAAAVYTNFSTDHNALNVKPLDSNSLTVYQNSHHAGTPEAFTSFVVGGARGGGGSNFTGSYSATASVRPDIEVVQALATISGHVVDTFGVPLTGALITMRNDEGEIVQQVMTDDNGFYQIFDVPTGLYSLTASKTAYDPLSATAGTVDGDIDGIDGFSTITGISLDSGDIGINYDFVLAPSNV